MEAGVSTHDRRVILEPAAALGLHLFQLIQRGEHPIGQWLIGERPKPRSLLDLGGIRREGKQLGASCECGRWPFFPPLATPHPPPHLLLSPPPLLSHPPPPPHR